MDRTFNGARLNIGMKQMFTGDVTFLAQGFSLSPQYMALLDEEGIVEGVRLAYGRVIPCEVIMGWGSSLLMTSTSKAYPYGATRKDSRL